MFVCEFKANKSSQRKTYNNTTTHIFKTPTPRVTTNSFLFFFLFSKKKRKSNENILLLYQIFNMKI